MNRFMGMMPSNEVQKEVRYKVGMLQLQATIQAGINGWTIIYADGSTEYKDVVDTVENNFNAAYQCLNGNFCYIKQIN